MGDRRESGLTLVEMAIAAAVLAVVGTGIFAVLQTGVSTYGIGATTAEVDRQATRVLDLIRDEISQAGADVLYPRISPPECSAALSLQRTEGWVDGQTIWTPPTLISFEYAPGERNDGKDNNGDGLVDEGVVIRRVAIGTPDEQKVVLARFVREYLEGEIPNGRDDNGNGLIDEPGLCFDVVGEVWTVRLTLERRDPSGRLMTHTVQTSIKTRN